MNYNNKRKGGFLLPLSSILVLLLSFFASCNNNDFELENTLSSKSASGCSFKVSPDEAKSELCDFMSQLNASSSKTRSSEQTQVEVDEVYPIRNGVHTRTILSEGSCSYNVDIDTLMYAINFADKKGFALVAADKRTYPILAIVDEGSFCVDSLSESKDEGFLSFLDYAIKMEIKDIANYEEIPLTRAVTTNGYTITSEYAPMLHTKWTQQSVYGKYCPNGIAGCVIIATAQILSHYKTIGHVNWSYNGTMGSSDLHWDKIISDCDNNNGKLIYSSCATSANEIAHLMRYLGIALGADYNKNSTSAKSSKAVDWFNKWGNLRASSLKGYNENAILSAIKSGYPVLARGNSGKKKILGIRVGWKGGHAWVYDGALVASKDGKSANFVHCNWGWGGYKNGYYISKAFNANAGATIYDPSDNQTGTASNYKYNLEYSIVKK